MNFVVEEVSGVNLVRISIPRATADVSKEFKSVLFDLIDNKNIQKIIVDFSKVDFADSSFLGTLVSGLKKCSANKGDIKILSLQPPVRAMFELTRLYKVFEIFDNEQDALKSF